MRSAYVLRIDWKPVAEHFAPVPKPVAHPSSADNLCYSRWMSSAAHSLDRSLCCKGWAFLAEPQIAEPHLSLASPGSRVPGPSPDVPQTEARPAADCFSPAAKPAALPSSSDGPPPQILPAAHSLVACGNLAVDL